MVECTDWRNWRQDGAASALGSGRSVENVPGVYAVVTFVTSVDEPPKNGFARGANSCFRNAPNQPGYSEFYAPSKARLPPVRSDDILEDLLSEGDDFTCVCDAGGGSPP